MKYTTLYTLILGLFSIGWTDCPEDFMERMQRVAQDFAQQHLADQRQPEVQREGYTLLLALRSWEFAAFTQLRR